MHNACDGALSTRTQARVVLDSEGGKEVQVPVSKLARDPAHRRVHASVGTSTKISAQSVAIMPFHLLTQQTGVL